MCVSGRWTVSRVLESEGGPHFQNFVGLRPCKNLAVSETLSYDLHKLGWRAFQDLSAMVLQAALGQTFHTFADSNDGGRDGAFYGGWLTTAVDDLAALPESMTNATAVVAQCKFSASGTGTLAPSGLSDELGKVKRLHAKGICDAYILMTNLRVSGETELWLREQLRERGVDKVMVLDGKWICQQISLRPTLRRYVPRVYGLGDLSQILDERRLEQARMLLANLSQDLATFVPTAAYRQAADALANHGFTILLGAPAAGKSTIAATLSTAALDEWGCGVRRVDSPAELVESWNPHEPDQLFWVDDAFGAIRHDSQLTDQWSRRLDQVMSAVKNGAKVILTSRDYIYKQARVHLKEYAHSTLREQAVVVDVAQLSADERRQILYNHLRAGDQPAETLRSWRPYLSTVAASTAFQPEVARRLGRRAFTSRISYGRQLTDYVERPVDFLKDVLAQLEPAARAALACVYLSGDGLPTPVRFSDRLEETITQLGATGPEVMRAFTHLDDTFLSPATGLHGGTKWRFRHPTIREGFAAVIADDPNVVHILVDGLTDEELVKQLDCGGSETGTLVTVPVAIYPSVAARVRLASALEGDSWYSPIAVFLTRRCSDEFLKLWAELNANDLNGLLDFGYLMGDSWRPKLLARLQHAGALPSSLRERGVDLLERRAIEDFDGTWLNSAIVGLFTPAEKQALLDRFIENVLPRVDDLIAESADGYANDVSPADRYSFARDTVDAYLGAFDPDTEVAIALEAALTRIDSMVAEAEDDFAPQPSDSFAPTQHLPPPPSERDLYDDVDAGH